MIGWVLALGAGVADHLWQSTVFVLAIWLLTQVLANDRARVRHALWLAASVKFLIPFAVLVVVGRLLPPSNQSAAPIALKTMRVAGQPFAELAAPKEFGQPVEIAALPILSVSVLSALLGMAWLAGAAVVFGVWSWRWRVALWTLQKSRLVTEGREVRLLRGLEARWRARQPLPLRLSMERIEPGVYGFLRPQLLWPRGLSARLDDEHIEAILAHELMHVKRRDNVAAAIHLLVKVLFWFHPLVWWMEDPMVKERERACDEAVLANGVNGEAYAESLLRTCRFCIERPIAGVAGVTGADFRKRILAIVFAKGLKEMTMAKRTLLVMVATLAVIAPILLGQRGERSTTLRFDVASVREDRSEAKPASNVPLGPGSVYESTGGVLRARRFTLLTYLVFAYKLADYQETAIKEKLPEWATQEHFTIEAHTENQHVTKDELRLMMQSLLEDRFGLKVHYEDRLVPVLALQTLRHGTTGPKLQPHPAAADCPNFSPHATDENGTPKPAPPDKGPDGFPSFCGAILGVPASAQDRYSFGARDVPMSFVSAAFSSWGNLGRPVVDETELKGHYDFVLDYTPEPRPAYATIDSGGPTFQEAIKSQLGLKLQPTKARVSFLVLDHVEEPSKN